MRPNAVEVLRGLQGTLATEIGPEIESQFGQSELRLAQMLLEMLANELDGAADHLAGDNQALAELLGRATTAVRAIDSELADDTATALAEPADPSLTITKLTARNQRLRGLLERVLVVCEDAAGNAAEEEPLLAIRSDAYRHLRQLAARGWSFWDLFSFRERMARVRATGS